MAKEAVVVVPGTTCPYGVLAMGEWKSDQVTVGNVPGVQGPVTFTLAVMTPAQTPPDDGTPVVVRSVEGFPVYAATWDSTELAITT